MVGDITLFAIGEGGSKRFAVTRALLSSRSQRWWRAVIARVLLSESGRRRHVLFNIGCGGLGMVVERCCRGRDSIIQCTPVAAHL